MSETRATHTDSRRIIALMVACLMIGAMATSVDFDSSDTRTIPPDFDYNKDNGSDKAEIENENEYKTEPVEEQEKIPETVTPTIPETVNPPIEVPIVGEGEKDGEVVQEKDEEPEPDYQSGGMGSDGTRILFKDTDGSLMYCWNVSENDGRYVAVYVIDDFDTLNNHYVVEVGQFKDIANKKGYIPMGWTDYTLTNSTITVVENEQRTLYAVW